MSFGFGFSLPADHPVLTPTLYLDFVGTGALDSRITFTRGSQATLFDSAGTLVYAKHNLLLQSQTFQTTWAATRINVSSDATTAPDGTLTADKLIATSVAGSHTIFQNVSVTPQAYTFSLYAKKGEYDFVQLNIPDPGAGGAGKVGSFNLATGTLGAVQDAGVTRTITAVGDGWYRCTVTFTPTGAGTSAIGIFVTQTDVRAQSFTGNDVSGIFTWGGQLNLSNMEGGVTSSLTTYYPTTTAAYYGPRFDYDPSTLAARGLLIEEARTNSIRNNTMQGAVAGTPGTLPTNWSANLVSGITQEVVGIGTENGITYIDLKLSGTGTGTTVVSFDSTTQIVATSGQAWSATFYARLIAGSLTNISSTAISLREATAAGTLVVDNTTNFTPTSAALNTQRQSRIVASTNASTERVVSRILVTHAGAIDITLRIGLPQLELGAFATSVIPTTTTALTRNADVASMTGTNFSSWYNAVEGTVVTQSLATRQISTAGTGLASMDDGTVSNMIRTFVSATAFGRFGVFNSGATQADLTPGSAITANTILKLANTYALNNFASVSNGSAAQTDPLGTVPTVNRMTIGYDLNGVYLNGYIQRISYYPSRLPNGTLQALTA